MKTQAAEAESDRNMNLSDVLSRSAVRVISKESTKDDIFQEMGSVAKRAYGLKARYISHALLQREGEYSSAVGRGVAVPHCRFPEVEKTSGVFVKLSKPVDFKSRDRLAVDLVFGLLIPEDLPEVEHLKNFALIARTLRDPETQARIRCTERRWLIHTILTEASKLEAA